MTVTLAEVLCVVRNGLSIPNNKRQGGLPITRIETIADGTIDADRVGYGDINQDDANGYLLQSQDILFSHINSIDHIGKCAIYEGQPSDLVHGMNLLVLRSESTRIDAKYLLHTLRSRVFRRQLSRIIKPAVNQASLTITDLKTLTIPLPPLEEQKQIAAILDKAGAIRRKREYVIALADEFLRSLFLDTFGDPAHNPKNWPTKKLCELGKVITGNTPPRKQKELYGGGIEWIKSDNLNTPDHIATRATEFLSDAGKRRGRTVPPGSILVTCIAGSHQCIGNAAIVDREVAFNQQINAIVPNGDTDPLFLYAQVLVGKKLIQNTSTASMKGMVSKGRFEQIDLISPPFELQQLFGHRLKSILSFRGRAQELFVESVALNESLARRAFLGTA